MKDWFEIFRSGTWTDSRGRTREWTDADLDRVASTYDPASHEAPLVIGHPETNAPAYGWIEAVKREGNALLAKAKQVVPQFAEAVRQGLFKKRSISLYPDGRLRHVGFLGAAPPAVPGLKDLAFEAGEDAQTFEFEERGVSGGPPTEKTTHDHKENAMSKTIEQLEAELAQERTAREAAEQKVAAAAAEFAEAQKKTRRKDLQAWFDGLVRDAQALPAWNTQGMGAVEFLAQIDGAAEYEFSEGKKQTPAAWFQEFVQGLGSHPLFQEFARPAGDATREADVQLTEDLAAAKRIVAHVHPAKAGK